MSPIRNDPELFRVPAPSLVFHVGMAIYKNFAVRSMDQVNPAPNKFLEIFSQWCRTRRRPAVVGRLFVGVRQLDHVPVIVGPSQER